MPTLQVVKWYHLWVAESSQAIRISVLSSPSNSAVGTTLQIWGLLPATHHVPLGATGFGKGTQPEPRPLLCLAGLAGLNQFFLSSWKHSPDLPSYHSLLGQLKTALFWEPPRDPHHPPPPAVLLPRGIDMAPGPVSSGSAPHLPFVLQLRDLSGLLERFLLDCTEVGVGTEAQGCLGPLSGQREPFGILRSSESYDRKIFEPYLGGCEIGSISLWVDIPHL